MKGLYSVVVIIRQRASVDSNYKGPSIYDVHTKIEFLTSRPHEPDPLPRTAGGRRGQAHVDLGEGSQKPDFLVEVING